MLSIKAPLFAVLLVSLVCADNTYYSIWPKDSSDTATNKAISDELNLKVGTKNIYASESATIGFLFWYQQLSSDLVDHFSKWPGVRYVSPPCNQPQPGINLNQGACGIPYRAVDSSPPRASLVKRGAQTTQPNSPDQLRVLSQARGQALGDVKGYTYDDTAGQDVRVYMIDSGANTDHEDLKNTDFTWMFPGPNPLTGQKDDAGLDSHGTCMASMVGGIALGNAKKVKITMLKVPFNEDQEAWTVERTVNALAMVYDDIMLKELQGKAIVSMSWGVSNNLNQQYVDAFSAAYKYLIDALLNVDVYPVIAAGQDNSLDTDAVCAPNSHKAPPGMAN